ncbi:MAG: hypothetical protein KGH66_03055 [Candidatus Micrarchaeota archaeon]|nr:hypothetical protein [Candidatus Micrarchaeota archaeon]
MGVGKERHKNSKERKITITVSNSELEALEDVLIAWNLCRKHKAQTWSPSTGVKTSQEIFKMQDECNACQKQNNALHKKAWKVLSRLYTAWDKPDLKRKKVDR